MVTVKRHYLNSNIATIIVESIILPIALFLLLEQFWGLVMRESPIVKDFWRIMPMDISNAPELYVFGFSALGVWTWLRIWKYKRNHKKELEREDMNKKMITLLDDNLKINQAILDKLDKEKSNE